jgi:hypothetical protein
MGLNGVETFALKEGFQAPKSALDSLSYADISKRPLAIGQALNGSSRAEAVASKVLWKEPAPNPDANPKTLSENPEVREIQAKIYAELGISVDTDANNPFKKLAKGAIDGLIVGNAELVARIREEWIETFLSGLKEQLTTLEGWKKIAEALGTTVMGLVSLDAYKTGKSAAELWLITTGMGAAGSVAKMAGKSAVRASVKIGRETLEQTVASKTLYGMGRTAEIVGDWLQLPAKWVKKAGEWAINVIWAVWEKTGVNKVLREWVRVGNEAYEKSGAKEVVSATRRAVKASLDTSIAALGATEIVKAAKWKAGEALEAWQQAKYEKLEAEGKLLPREKLDIDMYSSEQLNWLKRRLWLAESAAKDEVEKAYRLRLYEAMEQYEKLWKMNLERMGTDILEQMRRQGIEDPKKVVANEIRMVREAYERGEIKIVRVEFYHPDIPKEWFRSPYQLGEWAVKPPKYGAKREGIDKDLWLYWLDPKYATVLVNEKELSEMVGQYAKNPQWKQVMVSVFDLASLQKRSGMTMYDTMLVGGVWKWKEYLLDIDDIFTVRALKNIEKWYNVEVQGIGDFQKLQSQALGQSVAIWERNMYREMPNFMELQIMWRVWPPVEHYVDTEVKNVFSK